MRTFLFILVLIVLIGGGLYLKSKGVFSGKSKGNSTIETSDQEKLSTEFTPQELTVLANNCNPDFIAGELVTKGLLMFKSKLSDQNYFCYSYYYISEKDNLYRNDQTGAEIHKTEKLTFWENEKRVFYILKNKQTYNDFISYLKKIKNEFPADLQNRKDFSYDSTFIIKNCIFFATGYSIDLNGFTFVVMTVDEYLRLQGDTKVIEKESKPKKKNTEDDKAPDIPSTAYICVNEAAAYSHATNLYGEICILSKGTKLTIIKEENGFYYCDFVDSKGDAKTGYIQSADLSFKKPKAVTE